MNRRLMRPIAISALPLIMALLGCALADVQTAKPANPPTSTPSKAGIPSVHEVAQMTTLDYYHANYANAACPPGEFALGGGWSLPNRGTTVTSAWLGDNTWEISFWPSWPRNGGTITTYVECLSGVAGATVTERKTPFNSLPTPPTELDDQLGGVPAACHQDEIPVGSGFTLGYLPNTLEIEASWPRNDVLSTPLWVFSARNRYTATQTIAFSIECLSNVRIPFPLPQHLGNVRPLVVSASYPRQVGAPISADMIASTVASCPAGTVVAGGGYQYTRHDTANAFLGSVLQQHATSSGWLSQIYDITGNGFSPLTSMSAAVCLSFS